MVFLLGYGTGCLRIGVHKSLDFATSPRSKLKPTITFVNANIACDVMAKEALKIQDNTTVVGGSLDESWESLC